MTVWEAMAMQLPVISTDVGDVSAFVRSGFTGEIVPVGDAQAISRAVIGLYNDKDLREAYAANSRSVIFDNFDLQKIAEQQAEFYKVVHSLNKSRNPQAASNE